MGKIKEREIELAPGRINYAINKIQDAGYSCERINETTIRFFYRDSPVLVYPYTGWFTGKSVKDGRGIHNLLKQITMRWALRNQEKIKAFFEPNGEEMLKRIKDSLNKFFKENTRIEMSIDISGIVGPYHTLSINDVGSDDRMIHFYIISVKYDVYKLAFIEFSKC